MKLHRIAIRRLAGLAPPAFELDGLADDINIVHGPNASGKSSIVRAVRALLDARALPSSEAVDIEAEFEDSDGSRWQVVRSGRSLQWSCAGQRSEPPLPEAHHLDGYLLHVEDLLAGEGRHDADIAREIARGLAGGYDFESARKACKVAVGPRFGHREAKALGEAEAELRGIEEEQRALVREEGRLRALEEELAGLGRRIERLPRVLRAKEWLAHRKRSREIEAMREDFPPAMDRLRGDEIERLKKLEDALERAKNRYETARAEAQFREREFQASGLSANSPDPAMPARIRTRLRQLKEWESDLQHARQGEREALAERDVAGRELGTPPGMQARIDPESLSEAERSLAAYRGVEAEVRAIEKELSSAQERQAQSQASASGAEANPSASTIEGASGEPDPDLPKRLRRGLRSLVRWTTASKHSASPARRIGFALSFFLCIVAGIVALFFLPPLFGGLGSSPDAGAAWLPAIAFFLLGAIAGLCGWAALDLDPGKARRERAQADFESQGIAAPARWTRESVQERIESLGDELAAACGCIDDARRIERLRERLSERRNALSSERERLEPIARKVHFDPLLLDASFERWLRLVDRYARADGDLVKQRDRCEYLAAEVDRSQREIDSFLAAYEDSSAPEKAMHRSPDSADILQSRLEILQARMQAKDDALRTKNDAEKQVRESRASYEGCRAEIASLYREAGLEAEDEAELRRRSGRLGQWRNLEKDRSESVGAEKSCTAELEGDADLTALARADDDQAIDRLINELEACKGQISSLQEEITRIRTLVDRAGQSDILEGARAKCRQRRDALEMRFEDAEQAEARAFWLDEIEAVHRTDSRPALLRRAEDWFAHFSRHRFALVPSPGDRFSARDTADGALRSLAELSTGTRMQLRLAVRIAWALEAEKGRAPLPFFLDEALTTADPERFRIVAQALTDFACREGRQIFYLTAQPQEAGYWQAPKTAVIDLAERRRLARAVKSAGDLALPRAPEPPPRPGDDSPEEYGQRLGVPAIDPWQPDATHLFYLLRDDLPLLRRLLVAGIDHIGALDSLLAAGDAAAVLTPLDRPRLQRSLVAAKAWFEAWQEGRARPVDIEALRQSGIVSDVFIERVVAIVGETKGDGRRLLEAVGSLRNFRKEKLEETREWLLERGHLSEEPPPDASALERRVAKALLFDAIEPASGQEEALLAARSLARSLQAGLPS